MRSTTTHFQFIHHLLFSFFIYFFSLETERAINSRRLCQSKALEAMDVRITLIKSEKLLNLMCVFFLSLSIIFSVMAVKIWL